MQRGPRCATRLAKRLKERGFFPMPVIYVLRNGWTGFVTLFRDDKDLVEDVDKKMWGRWRCAPRSPGGRAANWPPLSARCRQGSGNRKGAVLSSSI
eukprot:364262-Chlamydomonas_euryale.AAC.18